MNDIIHNLINNEEKQGCFSRDPYVKKNTFINRGSFILKINKFTKDFYNELIMNLENDIKNVKNCVMNKTDIKNIKNYDNTNFVFNINGG